MSSTQTTGKPPAKQGDCGCGDYDKDSATQVSINKVRATYCITLYDAKGAVSKLEAKYNGENDVYKEKKSIFINTEDNYRRYRNFDMCAGTEILQTNDSIKGNVGKLKDWNKALNTLLTNIAKQTKDLKSKFNDLSDAACKLGRAYDDKCNAAQRKALTGTTKDNCGDPTTVIDPCKNAGTDIEKLICIPTGLAQDADSIFQVSSDVIGVQLFSNIDALDQLQKDLSTKSTVFEKFINDTMKTRKGDVDKLQDDLVTSIKAITQVYLDRNWQRSVFEGYDDATEFLCCPECKDLCPPPDKDGNGNTQTTQDPNKQKTGDCKDDCPPRLKHYEDCICKICEEVQKTFCCDDPVPTTPTPTDPQQPSKPC